jgi:hypothetical protein
MLKYKILKGWNFIIRAEIILSRAELNIYICVPRAKDIPPNLRG